MQPVMVSFDQTDANIQAKTVQAHIQLENESILKQTMSISVDRPELKIGSVIYQPTAEKKYIPEFANNQEIFEHDVTITIPIQNMIAPQPIEGYVHVSFLTLPNNTMHEKIYQLSFEQSADQSVDGYDASVRPSSYSNYAGPVKTKKSFTDALQESVQNNNNIWIRLLFAFLLGLLLSLTPCIYPMIPLTIGVLHNNNQSKSLARNFLGSLCYAFGLSTTFASLGLLAAFAGASFGSLLSQPIFVLVLVAFIGYMSLTMIGVIDLKMPSFLQRGTQFNGAFGPFLSAFLFGIISGTVASPCVSPGLALLLTLVATMGNVFAGFLLLFCFGIGMSVPLIIIGTFSSSMNMLPQAGMWMVEIKKALGFVMLATCLYYLNNILPSTLFNWVLFSYVLFAALFYIIDAQKDHEKRPKTIKSLLGIILLALAVVVGIRAYDKMTTVPNTQNQENGVIWNDDYEQAVQSAIDDKKLILLDFWANHCTICKAIDKKLFQKDVVWKTLQHKYEFVKVDCTSSSNEQSNKLKEKYHVFAQPTILVIQPTTGAVIKKWSSEPYSMSPEEFINEMLAL